MKLEVDDYCIAFHSFLNNHKCKRALPLAFIKINHSNVINNLMTKSNPSHRDIIPCFHKNDDENTDVDISHSAVKIVTTTIHGKKKVYESDTSNNSN